MNLEINITKRQIISGVVLAFVAGLVFLGVKRALYFEEQYEKTLFVLEEKNNLLFEEDDLFGELSLSAEAFFVWDAKTGEKLGGRNEETQLPLASLTKLMTILVASELSTPQTVIKIKPNDLNTSGDNGLVVGEEWKFSDIIDFILLTSSNDGAQALASVAGAFDLKGQTQAELFIDLMNQKAQQLGMSQTFFLNGTGLDINETTSGAYGSAKDITLLVENILRDYPNLLEVSAYGQAEINSNTVTHQVGNTNSEVEFLPNVIASKTGFTDLAGGNLIVVFDAGINHPVIVSVLGSTKEERFRDVEKLIWAGLEKIFSKNQAL